VGRDITDLRPCGLDDDGLGLFLDNDRLRLHALQFALGCGFFSELSHHAHHVLLLVVN